MTNHRLLLVTLGALLAAMLTACSAAPIEEAPPTDPAAEGLPNATQPAPVDTSFVLPQALYFVNAVDDQIWRLEPDLGGLAQITNEAAPIDEYTISQATGRIAYTSGNTLFVAEPDGSARMEILVGPVEPEDFLGERIQGLTWSPDGAQLAYGFGGVVVHDMAEGASSVLLANDPQPDFNDPEYTPPADGEPATAYWPERWSPVGGELLINAAVYFSDGLGYEVLDLESGSLILLTTPDGQVCCFPSWSPNGEEIYVANATVGFLTPGMWRIDASSGEGTSLLPNDMETETLNLASHARLLPDGLLYRFQTTVQGFPEVPPPLQMARSQPGSSATEFLRDDAYVPGDVLWAPDGSGAVIMDLTAQYEEGAFPDFPARGVLLWLPADDSAPVALDADGAQLAWGP